MNIASLKSWDELFVCKVMLSFKLFSHINLNVKDQGCYLEPEGTEGVATLTQS